MIRRVLLSIYALVVGAGYAAVFQIAVPGESALLPVRGLNVVLFMVVYGWCCGKDPLLPVRRSLIEIPLFPFALLGAAMAGCVCLVSFVITRLFSFLWKTAAN